MYIESIWSIPDSIVCTAVVWWSIYMLSKLFGIWSHSKVFNQWGHYYKVKLAIDREIDHIRNQEYLKQGTVILHYLGTSSIYALGSIDIARALMGSNISTKCETRLSAEHSNAVIAKALEIVRDIAQKYHVEKLVIKANQTDYYRSYIYYIKMHPEIWKCLAGKSTIIQWKTLLVNDRHIFFDNKNYSPKQFIDYLEYMGSALWYALINWLCQCYKQTAINDLRYFRDADQKLQLKKRTDTSHHTRMRLYRKYICAKIKPEQMIEHKDTTYIYLT